MRNPRPVRPAPTPTITPELCREMLFAGYSTVEMARIFHISTDKIRNYLHSHGLTRVMTDDEDVPPPELRPGKLLDYRASMDPCSGNHRLSRISLPAISMHIAERRPRT